MEHDPLEISPLGPALPPDTIFPAQDDERLGLRAQPLRRTRLQPPQTPQGYKRCGGDTFFKRDLTGPTSPAALHAALPQWQKGLQTQAARPTLAPNHTAPSAAAKLLTGNNGSSSSSSNSKPRPQQWNTNAPEFQVSRQAALAAGGS